MKKKFYKILAFAAIVFMAGYGVYNSHESVILSDLSLANIEALADSEYNQSVWVRVPRDGGGHNCYKGGAETCL
jgi:hypothetical protein